VVEEARGKRERSGGDDERRWIILEGLF